MSAGSTTESATQPTGDVDYDVFERRYLAHAASQLPGRGDESLGELARYSLALGTQRRPDDTIIAAVDGESVSTRARRIG